MKSNMSIIGVSEIEKKLEKMLNIFFFLPKERFKSVLNAFIVTIPSCHVLHKCSFSFPDSHIFSECKLWGCRWLLQVAVSMTFKRTCSMWNVLLRWLIRRFSFTYMASWHFKYLDFRFLLSVWLDVKLLFCIKM